MVVALSFLVHLWITLAVPKRKKDVETAKKEIMAWSFLAHSWITLDCSGGPIRGHLELKHIVMLCIWLEF